MIPFFRFRFFITMDDYNAYFEETGRSKPQFGLDLYLLGYEMVNNSSWFKE